MTDDLNALTFEEAMTELDGLIARLEGGKIPLEEAVGVYSRGTELAAHCAALLDRTEATITQLVGGAQSSTEIPVREGTGAVPSASALRARTVAGGGAGLFTPPAAADPDVDPEDIPF